MNFLRCKHLRRDDDYGTPFCADCGLVFDDEIMYTNECHNMDYHYTKDDYNTTKHDDDYETYYETKHKVKYEIDHETNNDTTQTAKSESDSDSDSETFIPIPKSTPTPTPKSTPTPIPIPKPNPKNVKDLIRLAKERGIKYSTTMSKKDLCAILGVEITKPPKVILRNNDTGEERKFYSIYEASKETGVNPGLIHYYMNKELKIGEITYTVSKV